MELLAFVMPTTIDDIKSVADAMPITLVQWTEGVMKHNKGRSKADYTSGGWKAPLKSYLKLISNRLNEAGFTTQRGIITPNYILKLIRTSEDPVAALGYLFGKGALIAFKAMWALHRTMADEMRAMLKLITIYGKAKSSYRTGNNRTDNYGVDGSKSLRDRMTDALDRLQGLEPLNRRVSVPRSGHKDPMFLEELQRRRDKSLLEGLKKHWSL
jgi:hypothetical protein